MTTPPKARRFHLSAEESPVGGLRKPAPDGPAVRLDVKRGPRPAPPAPAAQPCAQPGAQPAAQGEGLFAVTDDGFGNMRFPGATGDTRAPGSPVADGAAGVDLGTARGEAPRATDDARIAAIRAENLTSRQLRMAARIAAMHGIEAASEHEAVMRLRDRGIDPFHRGAVGKVLAEAGSDAQNAPSPHAPVRVKTPLPSRTGSTALAQIAPAKMPAPATNTLPSREALTEERRATEIYLIQRDIARRRRRNLFMLFARLAVFVGLPTVLAGWYYFTQATPLYATQAQFMIQQADAVPGGSPGGMLAGAMMNPDNVAVQSYLTSRDAMIRLDRELGFTRAFQDPSIDPLKRLPADATQEDAYKVYRESVKISYDPTEGVINMEVVTPDPQLSQQFGLALIRYAEGQVDQLTARLRDDQMKGASDSYEEAERKVQEAQARVQQLQEKLGVLDPLAESSAVMGRISSLESDLAKKQLELGQLEANPRPNPSRVSGVRGDIARIERLIAETRAQLTENQGNRASLAAISGELKIADSDLQTRQTLLAAAAEQMEMARVEANKQVRYLSLSVAPVPPDEATYPKALQNTIVAFLIFAGIYLMLSLTASILREQVSS